MAFVEILTWILKEILRKFVFQVLNKFESYKNVIFIEHFAWIQVTKIWNQKFEICYLVSLVLDGAAFAVLL